MEPFDVSLEAAVFVVVDMQNDFVRVGAPLEVADTRMTIPPIRRVLERFRQAGRPVVFTRFIAAPRETLLWKWSPQIYPPDKLLPQGFPP